MKKNSKKRNQDQYQDNKYDIFKKNNKLIDLILPDVFSENKDYIYLGPKKYVRVYSIIGYPRNMHVGYLNDLFSLGDIDISTYVENIPDGEIISRLTSKYSQLQSNINLQLKRGNPLDYGMKLAAQDIDALREAIQTNQERMFYTQPLLLVWGRNLEELDKKSDLMEDICSRKSIKIRCLAYEQNKGFASALPMLNISFNKYLRNMTTGALACMIPIGNTELSHKRGILFGENLYTKSLIFYDNFIGAPTLTNPHTFVFGTTGAGKSVFLKVKGARGAAAKKWIVALDPQEEYKKMVKKLGGQYIVLKPGVKSGINPFELEVEEDEHGKKKIDLYGKRTQIINMISIFAENFRGQSLKGREITAVDEVVNRLYTEKCGITEEAESLYLNTDEELDGNFYTGKIKKDLPTLSDLRNGLIEYNKEFKLEGLEELTEIMKMITGDGPMSMFDCQSSVSFEKRVIGISFKHLSDEFTKFFATVNTMSWIWGKFSNWQLKDIEKEVIVDEGSLFAKYSEALNFIELIARLGRKFKISLTLATQFIQDFLSSQSGTAIINLCATKIILKQDTKVAKEVAEFFSLSSRCKELISSFVSGQAILLSEQDLVVMQVTPFDFEWKFART
ncbi:MAG: DUF87 domain-containing protein [Tissierellia bacterium]|nr:DUF87 domain-containing protein [Tissierellia bacterium]